MERKGNYLSFRSCSGAVDVDRCECDQCLDAQLHRLFICLVEYIHHFLGIRKGHHMGMDKWRPFKKYYMNTISKIKEIVNQYNKAGSNYK